MQVFKVWLCKSTWSWKIVALPVLSGWMKTICDCGPTKSISLRGILAVRCCTYNTYFSSVLFFFFFFFCVWKFRYPGYGFVWEMVVCGVGWHSGCKWYCKAAEKIVLWMECAALKDRIKWAYVSVLPDRGLSIPSHKSINSNVMPFSVSCKSLHMDLRSASKDYT